MKMSENMATAYQAIPVVSELNKVPQFDPLRFLKNTKYGPKLDLKYKKLWFRLKYPQGRIRPIALKITDKVAIIEARIYFDKDDEEPKAAVIAEHYADTAPDGLYIAAAQTEAIDRALSDAGFGIQFVSMPSDQQQPEMKTVHTIRRDRQHLHAADEAQRNIAEITAQEPQTNINSDEFEEIPASLSEAASEESVLKAEEAVVENTGHELEKEMAEPEQSTEPEETEEIEEEGRLPYTSETPVEEILKVMSLEDAYNFIVPVGTCKGWTLSQVAERRPHSLQWYLIGYTGKDNILRAAAKLVHDAIGDFQKAS